MSKYKLTCINYMYLYKQNFFNYISLLNKMCCNIICAQVINLFYNIIYLKVFIYCSYN